MRKNIKLRVKNLVNKYQTADPFALAKELDVNILYVPLPDYSPARYECEANEFAIHLLNYSSDFIYDKDYILEVLAKENPNPYEVHKIINALMQIESI